MTERPGIMLYFDMAEPLRGLGYAEKGQLLEAILDYGQFGVIPEFEGLLAFAWSFIRPKLDADARSYRKKVVRNTHSSYCASEKKNGNNFPLNFEEWCAREGIDTTEWHQVTSVDAKRYPTTTPTTTPTITTNPMTNTMADAEGGGKGEEGHPSEDVEAMRQRKIAMLADYH